MGNPQPFHEEGRKCLDEIFNESTEGFQVIDRNWGYVYVNETVAKHGQTTVDQLLGHTMMEKYPGIENTLLFTYLKRCMEEKVKIEMENEFAYKDGTKNWFQLYIHPWSNGIMIFSVDISQRKLDENNLLNLINQSIGAASSETDRRNIEEIKKQIENLHKPSINITE